MIPITSHHELEMLHDRILLQLVDITTIINYFISSTNISASESNSSIISTMTSDIISNLYFSSCPVIYWEEKHYVPVEATQTIRSHIHHFLYDTYIPIHEVSRIWKVSSKEIQLFIEKKYLQYHLEDEENLMLEKSTGLSVYDLSISTKNDINKKESRLLSSSPSSSFIVNNNNNNNNNHDYNDY